MMKMVCGFALCAYEYHADAKRAIISLNFKNRSAGTSFAIAETGLAICSKHTIDNDEATTKDGKFVRVIATDNESDLALLQLPAHQQYKYLKLGDSDTLIPGEELYHYGYGMNTLIGNKGYFQSTDGKFLFASTEMMHGQSGGPVLNTKGEVVGICKGHMYCTQERIKQCAFHTGPSLYIPINSVKRFLFIHCEFLNGVWTIKKL